MGYFKLIYGDEEVLRFCIFFRSGDEEVLSSTDDVVVREMKKFMGPTFFFRNTQTLISIAGKRLISVFFCVILLHPFVFLSAIYEMHKLLMSAIR
jgi:hypothetical protein